MPSPDASAQPPQNRTSRPALIKDPWALRVRLQLEGRVREFALFSLGLDSKLRGCGLVSLKVRDVEPRV